MVSMSLVFVSKSCGFYFRRIFASLRYCKASSCTLSLSLSFIDSKFSMSDSSSSILFLEISETNSLSEIYMSLWLLEFSSLISTWMLLSTEASDGSESLWAWLSAELKVWICRSFCPLFIGLWDFTDLSIGSSPSIRFKPCSKCMLFTI